MRRLISAVILISFIIMGAAIADTAVDKNISDAMADIERYEQQFAGRTSANKSTVNRTLKLLKLTRQRLDSAADHSQPAWLAADERYNALVTQLNTLLNPSATNNTQSSQTSAPAKSSQQPASTTSSQATSPQMISHQRVQVKKLKRDLESAMDTIDRAGPKPFQDPAYVEKVDNALDKYRTALGRFSDFAEDPDVVAASNAFQKFEAMAQFGRDHAAKELAELGNVQDRLTKVNAEIRSLVIPDTPQQPYKSGELSNWLRSLATTRKAAIQIYQPLPEIKKRAYLPETRATVEEGGAFDIRDVDRMERYLRDVVGKIDNEVNTFSANLARNVEIEADSLSFYDEFDPSDRQQQAKHFLTEGRADEVRQTLAGKRLLVSEAAEYAKLLKHDTYDDRVALLARIDDVIERYEENYKKARQLVRMPKSATDDAELVEIAMETLESPDYDYVGEIKRLVVNTEKVHRTKSTSETQIDDVDVSSSGKITMSGTETTYFYEWDQYQVATAEPVGDKFYIFYSTLKNYSSGASNTPLNKWIISNRIQGSEIPEENIELD
ncbi:hypothetical protein [uncultured Sneathiella sp.]|uniref:hypothetical protein n=1 Tax=uncultured Sneathiella sp. TaxID=879315 RepID=UPI0030DC4145